MRVGAIIVCVTEVVGATQSHCYQLPQDLSSCGGSNINESFAGHCLRRFGLEVEEERFVILKNPISVNHHNILLQKAVFS